MNEGNKCNLPLRSMKAQILHRTRRLPVYISLSPRVLDEARVKADSECRTLSNLVEYALKVYIRSQVLELNRADSNQPIEHQEDTRV